MAKDQVTSIRVDSGIWKKARIYALENGLTTKELIEILIKRELETRTIEKNRK